MVRKRRRARTNGGLVLHDPILVELEQVQFSTYNPRTITDEEMASLKASMLEHGLVLNLVIQKEADDGTPLVLIGGHQRVRAARELCEENGWDLPEQAWAVVRDVDDRTARRLNVALNQIGGEFDEFKLGRLFGEMPDLTVGEITATGFTPAQIDELVRRAKDPDVSDDEVSSFASSVTLTVSFDSVAQRDRAKATLKDLVAKRGQKSGVVVFDGLKALRARKQRGARAR